MMSTFMDPDLTLDPRREELTREFEATYALLQAQPNDPMLRARAGELALAMGRREEAIANFVLAIRVDPSLTHLRTTLDRLCSPEELALFRVPRPVKPFWNDLGGVFGYPLKGNGLGILIGGSIFITAAAILEHMWGILVLGATIFLWGYLSSYYAKVVRTSALGEASPPDWPDISHPTDLVASWFRWNLGWIAAFLPAACVVAMIAWELLPPIGWGLAAMAALMGVFLYPMMALVTSLYGTGFAAFNYAFVVRSVLRVPKEYLLAWVFFVLTAILTGGLAFAGGMIGMGASAAADLLPQGDLAQIALFVAWNFFTSALSLYSYMVFCRVLGGIFHAGECRLGWFESA